MGRTGKLLLPVFLLAAVFSACGGGGGGGTDTNVPQRTLSWDPPTQYTDNTNIANPLQELGEYWVYVKTDNTSFTPADDYVVVSAVDPATNLLVESFDLRNAYLPLSLKTGTTYYVSMRAVSTSGVASDFSDPSPPFTF